MPGVPACCHVQCICVDRGDTHCETASAQAGISWPASKASILAPVTMRAQLRCLTFLATPMLPDCYVRQQNQQEE